MRTKIALFLTLLSTWSFAGIKVTPGSGQTVHTDTVGGDEYQAVKIIDGSTGGTSSATVTTIGLKVDLTTATIVGSTVGVSSILGALPAGSNSLGNVNIISSNTLPVSGTFFQTTQPIQGTVNVISTQPFTVYGTTVQVVNTTSTIQNIQNALPAGSNSLGNVNITSTNTLNIAGTLSVTSLSTGTINTPVPQVANYNGYVSPSGTIQAARVTLSSETVVYVVNPSTVTFNGVTQPIAITSTPTVTVILSTIAVSAIQTTVPVAITSTPTVTVILTTVAVSAVQGTVSTAILSTPTVSVILSTVGAVGMFSDNGVSSTTNRVTVLPGVYQTFNTGAVVPTQGRDAALTVLTDGLAAVANLPALRPYSYSASTNSFSIATSTNDAMALCGNATTTVEVYGIRASCTQTTAGNIQLGIVKRSSAYSGVWSTAPIVSQSSNYAGSKSTATFFTSANLVVGTLVGYLDSYKLGCMAAATATPNDIYISPSDWKMKPIVLNSASECVAINMNGATISGGSMSATFDFLERTPNNFNP